jgi:hypothetical protein
MLPMLVRFFFMVSLFPDNVGIFSHSSFSFRFPVYDGTDAVMLSGETGKFSRTVAEIYNACIATHLSSGFLL